MGNEYGLAAWSVDDEQDDARQRLPFAALLVLISLLFLRPWDHLPALSAIRPALVMTGITVGLYLLSQPHPIKILSIRPVPLFLAQLLVMLISVLFSYWQSKSLTITIDYAKQIALFVLIYNMITGLGRLISVVAVLVSCCAVHGAFAIANYAAGVEVRLEGIAAGNFEDPNDLALTLVMILPMAWCLGGVVSTRWQKILVYGAMLLLVGGVIATQSRGGLLALAAAVAVTIFGQGRERRRALLLTLGAAVALTAIVLPADVFDRYATIHEYEKDESAMIRLAVWKAGAEMFADHLFTGTGAGTFSTVYGQSYINREVGGNMWLAAHNSYVQIAAELGIFGLVIWVAIVVSAFLSLLRLRRLLTDDSFSDDNFSNGAEPSALVDQLRKWNAALLASIVGYLVGAVFLSRGYDLLFMILLAFIAVLSRRVEAIAANRA